MIVECSLLAVSRWVSRDVDCLVKLDADLSHCTAEVETEVCCFSASSGKRVSRWDVRGWVTKPLNHAWVVHIPHFSCRCVVSEACKLTVLTVTSCYRVSQKSCSLLHNCDVHYISIWSANCYIMEDFPSGIQFWYAIWWHRLLPELAEFCWVCVMLELRRCTLTYHTYHVFKQAFFEVCQ